MKNQTQAPVSFQRSWRDANVALPAVNIPSGEPDRGVVLAVKEDWW
jgi:hypothetical protein